MSLRWENAEITAAIKLLGTVDKAFRDPAETAPILAKGKFVRGLRRTLQGLLDLLRNEAEVEWEDDLIEHARSIRTGIEQFRESVGKSDIAMQEAAKGLCVLSRSEQSDLEACLKSLQDTTSRSQLVLDMFISLRALSTLLEQSRNSTRSVGQLKAETQQVCRILPTVASSIIALNDGRPSQFRGLKDVQQYAEFLVRGDLDDTKTSLLELQEVQIPLSQESRAQWQEDLGVTIEELCTCCRTYLDVLLKRRSESGLEAIEIQRCSWQKAINSLVQIVDGELAGGLSIAYALESREASEEELPKAIPSPAQPQLQGNETKREFLMAIEWEQRATTLRPKKPIQAKSYLPIPARSVHPYNRTKEMGSAYSSEKENSYIKTNQAQGQNSDWTGSAFSKPTWGSKSNQSSPRVATPVTKFQQRMFQRQKQSALSQEVILQDKRERSTKSMLGPDQYSFALERWVNDSDHLEMLLNTGEQIGKQDAEILIAFSEDYASAVGRFPKILMKTMSDWDDVYNSTKMMSAMGKVQIAT